MISKSLKENCDRYSHEMYRLLMQLDHEWRTERLKLPPTIGIQIASLLDKIGRQ